MCSEWHQFCCKSSFGHIQSSILCFAGPIGLLRCRCVLRRPSGSPVFLCLRFFSLARAPLLAFRMTMFGFKRVCMILTHAAVLLRFASSLAIEAFLCSRGFVHRQIHSCLCSDQHLFCRLMRRQILTNAAFCFALEQAWQIRRVCMLGDWERESVFATILREGKEVVSTQWPQKVFVLANHLNF